MQQIDITTIINDTRSASFFGYPGGKSRLRAEIIDRLELGAGVEYREPFFGGANVGLSLLPRLGSMWINDRDPALVSLWLSVLHYPSELRDRIIDFRPSPEAFHRFRDDLISLAKIPHRTERLIEVGFRKLATHGMSFSCLGVKSTPRPQIEGKWNPSYICRRLESLHLQFSTVNVRCTCMDFSELIRDETKEACLYLDPPYFGQGNRCYLYGFTLADHRRLALLLRHTPHQWVLSYDDCLPIRELYSWARIETVGVKYTLENKLAGRPARSLCELLIRPPKHQSVGVFAA
jgi:DNA adenine methylase